MPTMTPPLRAMKRVMAWWLTIRARPSASSTAADLESWGRSRPAASTSSSVTWWTAWTSTRMRGLYLTGLSALHRELRKLPPTACWPLTMQLSRCDDCPLLTVDGRKGPMVRAHPGHGHRARTWLAPSGMVTSSVAGEARPGQPLALLASRSAARQPGDLFRVRDRRALAATCAVWPNVAGEQAGSGTASDRCCPLQSVVRGPDVAPMWPQRSRAWKARPESPLSRDSTPMPQVRSVCDRPLLTVRDRQMPVLRARPARTNRAPAWRRRSQAQEGEARPGDHRPHWQALIEGAAAPCWLAVAEREGPVLLQRRVGRVVDAAARAVGPVPNAEHSRVPVHPGLGEDGADQHPRSILALPQQHPTARLPGLVGFDTPDRGQREAAAADQGSVGLVGWSVPQLSAATVRGPVGMGKVQEHDTGQVKEHEHGTDNEEGCQGRIDRPLTWHDAHAGPPATRVPGFYLLDGRPRCCGLLGRWSAGRGRPPQRPPAGPALRV